MSTKPITLMITSFIYFVIGISLPFQIILMDEHSISEWPLILNKITIFNWLVIFGCLLVSKLLSTAHSSLKYLLPLLFIIVSVNNFYVSEYSSYTHPFVPHFCSFLFLVLTLLTLNADLKSLINNPTKRWWLIPTRYLKKLSITLELNEKDKVKANTFDISESGTYIAYTDEQKSILPFQLKVGELINIKLEVTKNISISCKARIIRKSLGKGHYPAGVGIQFEKLDIKNRFLLFKALNPKSFSFLQTFS